MPRIGGYNRLVVEQMVYGMGRRVLRLECGHLRTPPRREGAKPRTTYALGVIWDDGEFSAIYQKIQCRQCKELSENVYTWLPETVAEFKKRVDAKIHA